VMIGIRGDETADAGTDQQDVASLNTAEAIRTDLIDETEYDATLGHMAAEPITAIVEGTVTSTPEPGDVIENGSVIATIDGEPVVALTGETPAYRDLTGHPDPRPVVAGVEGVVTALPAEGDELVAGDIAYELDGRPVVVLEGDVPPYRSMSDLPENMTGEDVLQLERNLDAFGLAETHGVTVDDEFTSATADALEALQKWIGMEDDRALDLGEFIVVPGETIVVDVHAEVGDAAAPNGDPLYDVADGAPVSGPDVEQLNDALVVLGHLDAADHSGATYSMATERAVRSLQSELGMEADGSLDLGDVRFMSESLRVAEVAAPTGTTVTPGAVVLNVTGEDTLVRFDLPAADQGVVEVGQDVRVELPDGTSLGGSISAVASVATVADDQPVFEVEVTLDEPAAAAGLDEAPVDVAVVTDSAEGVVAVPVTALIALREGGYAVEVVDDTTTRLVAVEAGFFADGLVAIEGNVAPGDRVVVP